MATAHEVQRLQRALRVQERLLRDAHLYALRFGKGWDMVRGLQRLVGTYQETLAEARRQRWAEYGWAERRLAA